MAFLLLFYNPFLMQHQEASQADQLLSQGNIADAIPAYQRIIHHLLSQQDPSSLKQFTPQGLGNIQDQKGYYQFEISTWYKQQLAENKLSSNPFQGLALCFSFKNRIFQGRTWYQKMFSQFPNVYQFAYGLANCYYNSDMINQSFKMYIKATTIDSECDKAYQGLANICFYKLDQNDRAKDYALKAINLNPDNLHCLIILAFTEQEEQLKIIKLEQIIQKQPAMVSKVYHLIGVLKYQRGQIEEAIQFFNKSIEKKPYVSSLISLANISLLQGLYEQAVVYAKWSMQLQPNNIDGVTALGAALIFLQRYDEATQWLYAASQIKQTYYLPLFYLGMVNFKQQYYQQALQWFLEAEEASKDKQQILHAKIAANWQLHQTQAATKSLLNLSKKYKDDRLITFHAGRLYYERQMYDQSLLMMLSCIEAQPQELYPYFLAGNCLLNLCREEESEYYFRKSVEVDPNFIQGWLALGYLKSQDSRCQDFLQFFRKVLQIQAENVQAAAAIDYFQSQQKQRSFSKIAVQHSKQKDGV